MGTIKPPAPERRDEISRTLVSEAPPGSTRHSARWLVSAGLVLLAAMVWLTWSGHRHTQPVAYKTQAVRCGDLVITVNATGTLEPTNQIDIGSELSGIIKSVAVDYNDRVAPGQILARLDTAKLKAAVQQYKAALEAAEANLMQAQATVRETGGNLTRLQKAWELSDKKIPSQTDLDAARAAFERSGADEAGARAAVSQARATLEVNEADLSKTVIRSPIKGIVLTRSVDPGQTVAASLEAPVLFTLAEDLTQMELHVDVDEADVSRVMEGQAATFTVDAYPDRTFPAGIRQVRYGAQTTEGVVTYETVLNVDNAELLLRPGMTATADITVREIRQVILIPNAALRYAPPPTETDAEKNASVPGGIISRLLPRPPRAKSSPGQAVNRRANHGRQQVWTLRNGRPVSIPVTIGATDGSMTQVISGALTPGMELVVDSVSSGT